MFDRPMTAAPPKQRGMLAAVNRKTNRSRRPGVRCPETWFVIHAHQWKSFPFLRIRLTRRGTPTQSMGRSLIAVGWSKTNSCKKGLD